MTNALAYYDMELITDLKIRFRSQFIQNFYSLKLEHLHEGLCSRLIFESKNEADSTNETKVLVTILFVHKKVYLTGHNFE